MLYILNYTVEFFFTDAFNPAGRFIEIPASLPIEANDATEVGGIAVVKLTKAYPMNRVTFLGHSVFTGVFKTVGGRGPKV